MEDLFGGTLSIRDNFSSILSKFSSGVSSAGSSFSSFTSQVGAVERANRMSLMNMQNDMKRYTDFYVSQGYTVKQAMSKATSAIDYKAPTSGNKWIDAFGKIKQVGTDAFGNIGERMQNFSNSTLGTITKLTAGFVSVKAAIDGIKEGLKTGMEYQNLRLVLDNLYKSPTIGAEKFKMGTDFAASSIWQERDVIKSLSMLKGSGLDDSKEKLTQMSDLGSYAKAMGVGDIGTATRAYTEMMMGRWNMMTMDLSINREEVEKYAKEHNMKSFDTGTGQITDKAALDEAFKGYINSRGLTGLTEKMGQTATGKLSTFMDNFKKSLADLVGITNTGEVRNGSLFDKFTQGIEKFTKKIQEFSESPNFTKMSDMISNLGNSIYNGFSFVLDHPEIAADLIELSAGLWALGKVSSVISAVSTVAGLFKTVGAAATEGAIGTVGLTGALAKLIPAIGIATGSFMALKSMFSKDGTLNKMMGEGLGAIFGDDVKQGWNENTKAISNLFSTSKEDDKTIETDPSKMKWYGGPDGKTLITDNSNIKYKTASDMVKDGDITKNNSNSYNNKTEVNVNIAKVEKTADIDEAMDAVVKRLTKYQQTRNNIDSN